MPWWKPFMMRCASNKGVMLRCIRVAEALVNNNENTSPRILRRRSKARADARLKLIAQPFLLFCAPHTNSAPAAADRGPKSSRNKQEQGVPELETPSTASVIWIFVVIRMSGLFVIRHPAFFRTRGFLSEAWEIGRAHV